MKREENVSREMTPEEEGWIRLIDWSQVQTRPEPRQDLPFVRVS